MKKECISCKVDISAVNNSVIFDCPSCGKVEIVRCGKCRGLSTDYRCPNCDFVGP